MIKRLTIYKSWSRESDLYMAAYHLFSCRHFAINSERLLSSVDLSALSMQNFLLRVFLFVFNRKTLHTDKLPINSRNWEFRGDQVYLGNHFMKSFETLHVNAIYYWAKLHSSYGWCNFGSIF